MARGFQHHLDMLARHRDVRTESPRGQAVAHHVHQRLVAREIGREFGHIVHAVLPMAAHALRYDNRSSSKRHTLPLRRPHHKENPMPAKRPAPRLALIDERT